MAGYELRFAPLEVRFDEGAEAGAFAGYASVFGQVNSYGDVVAKGAFRETLKGWKGRKKLPPMLLQHGMGAFLGGDAGDLVPLGRWTAMEEDDTGLRVEGRLIAMDTERGRTVYGALKEGVLDGLSIGFTAKEWSVGTKAEEPRRTLKKVELWEVSLVTFPADESARIREVRNTGFDPRRLEDALRDGGLSQRDRKAAVAIFREHLRRDAGVPEPEPRDEAAAAELAALLKTNAAIWSH